MWSFQHLFFIIKSKNEFTWGSEDGEELAWHDGTRDIVDNDFGGGGGNFLQPFLLAAGKAVIEMFSQVNWIFLWTMVPNLDFFSATTPLLLLVSSRSGLTFDYESSNVDILIYNIAKWIFNIILFIKLIGFIKNFKTFKFIQKNL